MTRIGFIGPPRDTYDAVPLACPRSGSGLLALLTGSQRGLDAVANFVAPKRLRRCSEVVGRSAGLTQRHLAWLGSTWTTCPSTFVGAPA